MEKNCRQVQNVSPARERARSACGPAAHTGRRLYTPAPAPPECLRRARARATTYRMLVGIRGAYTAVDGGPDGGGGEA